MKSTCVIALNSVEEGCVTICANLRQFASICVYVCVSVGYGAAGRRRGKRMEDGGWRMAWRMSVVFPRPRRPEARAWQGGGGVFTPLEPYRRPKPIKTGLFSFWSRPKAVPKPYRGVPGNVKRET